MNRHERRKAKMGRVEYVDPRTIDRDKLVSGCAWDGCAQTFKGDMPPGWTWLLTYWSKRPEIDVPITGLTRDGCLCPQHTQQLESKLKELGSRLLVGPAAGSA